MRIELYERPVKEVGLFMSLSSTQKANLRKLADFLKALPVDYDSFDMATFHRPKWGDSECGTVACALGHGPMAGIGEVLWFDWDLYAWDHFGIDRGMAWIWLFGLQWTSVDNTPHGAAARIEWFLKFGGIPEDIKEQLDLFYPSAPSYKVIQD